MRGGSRSCSVVGWGGGVGWGAEVGRDPGEGVAGVVEFGGAEGVLAEACAVVEAAQGGDGAGVGVGAGEDGGGELGGGLGGVASGAGAGGGAFEGDPGGDDGVVGVGVGGAQVGADAVDGVAELGDDLVLREVCGVAGWGEEEVAVASSDEEPWEVAACEDGEDHESDGAEEPQEVGVEGHAGRVDGDLDPLRCGGGFLGHVLGRRAGGVAGEVAEPGGCVPAPGGAGRGGEDGRERQGGDGGEAGRAGPAVVVVPCVVVMRV